MKKKSIAIILVLILLGIILILICNKKVNLNIKKFSFNAINGMTIESITEYKIECTNKCIAKIKPNGKNYDEVKEFYITDSDVVKLEKILNKYNVIGWDGFSEMDSDVLDGNSFSMEISLEEGKTIIASGYMKYPENYKTVTNEIDKLFIDLYSKH